MRLNSVPICSCKSRFKRRSPGEGLIAAMMFISEARFRLAKASPSNISNPCAFLNKKEIQADVTGHICTSSSKQYELERQRASGLKLRCPKAAHLQNKHPRDSRYKARQKEIERQKLSDSRISRDKDGFWQRSKPRRRLPAETSFSLERHLLSKGGTNKSLIVLGRQFTETIS
ncbi:hypothetical protein BDR22DRAFT_825230 [Usnea florida]